MTAKVIYATGTSDRTFSSMTERTLSELDMDIATALRGAADLFAERARLQEPPAPQPDPVPPPAPIELPFATLSTSNVTIPEADGMAIVTASLDTAAPGDVRIYLEFSGSAVRVTDYDSDDLIDIPRGERSGSVTISSIDDPDRDPGENIVLRIKSAAGVRGFDESPVTIAIIDDEPEPEPKPPYVARSHSRLFWRDDVGSRIEAAPTIMGAVVKAALSPTLSYDRMLSRAILHWLGNTLHTAGAIADLLALQFSTRVDHYNIDHLQPIAIGYDWLYYAMTDEDRGIVRNRIEAALYAESLQGYPDLLRAGYNHDSGIGMIAALAIHGETEIDWVAKYHADWWDPKGGFNRQYERDVQGGGTREGWNYLGDQAAIAAVRAAWESATGDTESLDYPWLNEMPLLLLHQTRLIPLTNSRGEPTGKYDLFSLPCFGYGGDVLTGRGFSYLFAAGTGNKDPKIAGISAWLLNNREYTVSTAAEEFIFRVLIGDPRVKVRIPDATEFPDDYTRGGYHYDRTGGNAIRVFFGCGNIMQRFFPAGDVMVWSKGRALLGSRDGIFRHHYADAYMRNVVNLFRDDEWIAPLRGDSTPRRKRVCSFIRVASSPNAEGDYFVCETQGLYPGKADLIRRTWRFDRATQTIIVTDEIKCADGLTPRISWNTPNLPAPVTNGVGRIVGIDSINGPAICVMTFDVPPAEVKCVGGETSTASDPLPWANQYNGKPRPRDITDATMFATFLTGDREQQIEAGGFYTVYVTPPRGADGVYRLTTTIRVL